MPSKPRSDDETLAAPWSEAQTAPPTEYSESVVAGRYRILRMLGSGGMGTVYQARDTELDELVALKVLRRELCSTPAMLERFKREAKLARRVTHRNVARMFDIGEHAGEKFLTMEFVEGESLGDRIDRVGRLAVEDVVALVRDVCDGLSAAHAVGVIHRDLKPDNVLCATDGRYVITDFGIARSMEVEGGADKSVGILIGTPAYMAPEQVDSSSPIDARTDVYALGAILFELLTGERAWPGNSPLAVATARLVSPPPDPRSRRSSLGAPYAEVVLRCMARKPDDRFSSVGQISAAMSAAHSDMTASPGMGPPSLHTSVAPRQEVATPDKTVAVLPFRNAGPAEDDYFADGLTDDLIDTLSMTRGLRVRSRGVVMKFKGVDRDPRELGRELDVQAVVEGTIKRVQGAVRVTARFIGVADGFQLWAKRWDRPETDLLLVSDEVARAIADGITVEHGAPTRAAPENPLTIELYLRARQEYRKFWRQHLLVAVQLFERALALSPDDATILSGYAMARSRLRFLSGDDDAVSFERVLTAAQRAIAAAPRLGEPHLALATVNLHRADGVGAVREAYEAIARAPGLAEAHAMLGRIAIEVGRIEEGIARHQTALAIDPMTPGTVDDLARGYALLGDWDRARRIIDVAESNSGVPWLSRGRLALWRGDSSWASTALADLEARDPTGPNLISRAVLKFAVSRTVEDIPDLDKLAGPARQRAFFHQVDTEIAAVIGHIDRAVHSLQRAVECGLLDIAWVDRCPALASMRSDARFSALRDVVAARAKIVDREFGSATA